MISSISDGMFDFLLSRLVSINIAIMLIMLCHNQVGREFRRRVEEIELDFLVQMCKTGLAINFPTDLQPTDEVIFSSLLLFFLCWVVTLVIRPLGIHQSPLAHSSML